MELRVLSECVWVGLSFSRHGLHQDEEPTVGKPLLAPDVLAGTTWQLRCIECGFEEGEIQPCRMPVAVRGGVSGMNLAQCIFYSSRLSRAATDTYGKNSTEKKHHREKLCLEALTLRTD